MHGAGGLRQGADAVTYIRPAVVACLELCCSHPGLPVRGPAPCGDSLAGPGPPLRNVNAAADHQRFQERLTMIIDPLLVVLVSVRMLVRGR